MRRLPIGEVLEFPVMNRLAYLHLIDYDSSYGIDYLRLLPGLYEHRPTDLEFLVDQRELCFVQFPTAHIVRKKMMFRIGNVSRDSFRAPQYMRVPFSVPGGIAGWHIVNTRTLYNQFVERLSEEQRTFSTYSIPTMSDLADIVANGYTPDQWDFVYGRRPE